MSFSFTGTETPLVYYSAAYTVSVFKTVVHEL